MKRQQRAHRIGKKAARVENEATKLARSRRMCPCRCHLSEAWHHPNEACICKRVTKEVAGG